MTGRQDANRHRYQLMTLIVLYTGFGSLGTEKDIFGTNVTLMQQLQPKKAVEGGRDALVEFMLESTCPAVTV